MAMTEDQREASDIAALNKPDPVRIWLTPKCESGDTYGRGWAEDHPSDCTDEGCGLKAVEYVRADLVRRMIEDAITDDRSDRRT